MTRLIAVDYSAGKALFDAGDNIGVIVNINERDVERTTLVSRTISTLSSSWLKVSADFEYPKVWLELAEAATTNLEIRETKVTNKERKFRVPQSVKDEALQSLNWVSGFERGNTHLGMKTAKMLASDTYVPMSKVARIARYFSRRPESIRENAGWQIGTTGFPSDERIRYGLWGGDSAREWSTNIANKHGLLASGGYGASPEQVPSDEIDGSKPHAYVDDPDIPGSCLYCGRAADDVLHSVVAGAFDYDGSCDYFGIGLDPDKTLVTGMLAHLPDDSWKVRENNTWHDTAPPSEDSIIIMLDEDSAYKLADILDDVAPEQPDILPFELASLHPHEAALVAAAYGEIDWDLVDRVFDIYDSTERSVNAKKQQRGAGGRFGDMPDAPADDAEATEQPRVQKARLPQQMDLVPDVASRIDEYLRQVEAERAQRGNDNSYSALVRLGELNEVAEAPQGHVTDVRPMYLAIVDDIDTEAVLDVISLVPPDSGVGGDVTVWRRNAGAWEPAPEVLADLRGTTPPPVVELSDDNVLGEVLAQVDEATREDARSDDNKPVQPAGGSSTPAKAPGATEVAPDGTSGTKPDANPDQQRRAASMRYFALQDGSFLIESVDDLKKAINDFGTAKNKKACKSHIKKRAKALGRYDLIPEDWGRGLDEENFTMWGPHGELMSLVAEGGADRNRGNAERLRRYWVSGEGAAKIGWNSPGDFYRCVSHLTKYLGTRSAGYCALRHKEATGFWPGQQENLGKGD